MSHPALAPAPIVLYRFHRESGADANDFESDIKQLTSEQDRAEVAAAVQTAFRCGVQWYWRVELDGRHYRVSRAAMEHYALCTGQRMSFDETRLAV